MDGHRKPHQTAMEFERKLDWFSRADRPQPHVFDGLISAVELQEGLGLHTLNATARQSFEVRGERRPGAVLHCFLEGSTDAELDGKPMNLGRRANEPVTLVLTSIREPLRFSRSSRPSEYVRKVSIQMSHDWLDRNGLSLPGGEGPDGVQRLNWQAGQSEIQVLEQLAVTSGFSVPVTRMQAEAMSLGLVARCFGWMSQETGIAALTPREKSQLHRVEAFARQPGPLPSLQALAAEGGLSLSGLRRLVQAVHGCAPLAHLRRLRLEQARRALEEEGLSLEAAAELAGYGSAANFATAFRRAFGMPPSQARGCRQRAGANPQGNRRDCV